MDSSFQSQALPSLTATQPPQKGSAKSSFSPVKVAPLLPSTKPENASETSQRRRQQQQASSSQKVDDWSSQKHKPARITQKVDGTSQKQRSLKQQLTKTSQKDVAVSELKKKSMKQQLTKTSQKDIAVSKLEKQPKKGATTTWTEPNPNFKYGQPMLTSAQLKSVGPATAALHSQYLKYCGAKKNEIIVSFKQKHLLRSLDSECFLVGFDDLYDLFNFDALDMSLLRCYTLSMLVEARTKGLSAGFLDPELLSSCTICMNRSYVVEYLRKAFKYYERKKCIMFAHNPGNHWILILVIPRWNRVLYFDSIRSEPRDHTLLREVLDEAFLSYCTLKKANENNNLVHVTKFPCYQQLPGNECGFYTAHHMMLALGLLKVDHLEEFEVMTTPLDKDVLSNIREKISLFIMNQVIDNKGEFHCSELS